MRILHLLSSTGWGGAERIACTVHRIGKQHGFESRVDAPAIPELVRGFREETGETLASDRAEANFWRWALAARARCKAFKPDLVHAHLATPGLAGASSIIAGRLPLVLTFQLLPRSPRWTKDYILPISSQRYLSWLLRVRTKRAFVAVSATDQERLSERFGGAAIELALNAPPLPPAAAPEATPLTWPSGALKLLSVGRLHQQKGFDLMLNALAAPNLAKLPWHWNIIGDGPERSALEEQTSRLGLRERVSFLGARHAHDTFAQADLVLCPARFEGMPLVPQEALLSGAPVLLSSIGPHVELLKTVPESFLPETEGEWSTRLHAMLSDATALSKLRAAQLPILSENPRERLWKDYAAVYEKLRALR